MIAVISLANGNGGSLINCICHTAGCKTLPDQLIQAELISGQGILYIRRGAVDVRRTNRLMGILYLVALGFYPLPCRKIILSIGF